LYGFAARVLSDALAGLGCNSEIKAVAVKANKRQTRVFIGLIGVLTATAGLLLALAPAPLTPEMAGAAQPLLAEHANRGFGAGLMQTEVPVHPGRWKSIVVRHGRGMSPDRLVGDHFVVMASDGDGAARTQMTARWQNQLAALTPGVDTGTVTVVLVGDLDRVVPSSGQIERGMSLVRALQNQLGVPVERVWLEEERGSPISVGRFFPTAGFREGLLR
jgi:hypothetical protein